MRNDDGHVEAKGADPLAGVQAIDGGVPQFDVEDDQVRMGGLGLVDGLVTISGFDAAEPAVFKRRPDE